jgi:hypothetical protein
MKIGSKHKEKIKLKVDELDEDTLFSLDPDELDQETLFAVIERIETTDFYKILETSLQKMYEIQQTDPFPEFLPFNLPVYPKKSDDK